MVIININFIESIYKGKMVMSIISASEAKKISEENANKKTIEDYRLELKNSFDVQLSIGNKFANVQIVKGFDSDKIQGLMQEYRNAGYVVDFKNLDKNFDYIQVNWD